MKICMKLRTPFILAAAVVLLGQARPAAPTVSPTALRTDGRIIPTLDPADPISLTWALTTTDPAARKLVQSGYQILAASSPDKLSEQQADLWNSGRIASADSVLVAYPGKHPAPAMLCRYPAHAEAVPRITWCARERALGVITGEVGAGKTVATRAAIAALDQTRHTLP